MTNNLVLEIAFRFLYLNVITSVAADTFASSALTYV
jgi:hypothetical protein